MMMCHCSVSRVWLAGVGFWFGMLWRFGCFAGLSGSPCRAGFTTLLTLAWFASVARTALVARAIVQLAKRAPKGFDLAFISELLALGKFDEFQNFFHLIHGPLERFDDFHDLIDRLADGRPALHWFGARLTDALS